MHTLITRARRIVPAVAVLMMATLAGCDILRASDPDIIEPGTFDTPEGADALRIGAIGRLANATGVLESTWLFGGLLADEFTTTSTFVENDETDKRSVRENNASVLTQYRNLNRVRTSAQQAINALKTHRPTALADIAEVYFIRGYAEMQLAETFCNGIPLSDATTDPPTPGAPLPGAEVLAKAVASFDTALATVGATAGATATRMRQAAQVGKARALRQLGRYAEARAAVDAYTIPAPTPTNPAATFSVPAVPVTFAYELTFAATTGDNVLWGQMNSARRYALGDNIEGNARNIVVNNAIPFFSAGDPRVRGTFTITTVQTPTGPKPDTVKGQDGATISRTTTNIYVLRNDPIQIVNGIDAEIIRAEERLSANDGPGMITILNRLRSNPALYICPADASGTTHTTNCVSATSTPPILPPLTDPGTRDAQIDLLFREKAFWTFGRGQRLGDLRHLARDYGRPVNQVFPTGTFFKGGTYGTTVAFPIPQAERNNPLFTGCLNENP